MSIQFPANPPLNDTFDYDGKTYIWDGEKWTASAIGSFDEAYVNISGDTMTGDLTVPSLNGGPLAGMRNQLINGCFRVWQRGNGPFNFNNTEFTADRWLKNGNGLVRKSALAPEGFTASLEVVATTPPIIQKIELPAAGNCGPFKQGSQWTVSLWSDRDISGGAVDLVFFTGNADNVVWTQQTWTATADPASNGFNRYSATFTAPAINASNTSLALYIENHVTTDTKYAAVQLEPGPVATPFEHRPIGTELALCQRYYQPAVSDNRSGAFNSTTLSNGVTFFTVPMRAAPTCTIHSEGVPGGGVVSSTGVVQEFDTSMNPTVKRAASVDRVDIQSARVGSATGQLATSGNAIYGWAIEANAEL